MTEEYLEGVLDDAKLDELAAELGISPDVMRKHPFFRVLKGRVLLTYPLKSYVPTYKNIDAEETDPTLNVFYTALEVEGAGALYGVIFYTDDAATVLMKCVQITLDGVSSGNLVSANEAGSEKHWVVALDALGALAGLSKDINSMKVMNVPFADSLKVEYKTTATLVGGKKIFCSVAYGEI